MLIELYCIRSRFIALILIGLRLRPRPATIAFMFASVTLKPANPRAIVM
jgi:hypothetical protein